MRTDITFGQYCDGNSLLHRLDPRMKLIVAILFIVELFLAKTIYAFAFIFAVACILIAISRIRLGVFIKGLKPVLIILIFTAVINIFWTKGDTLLFSFWKIEVYLDGIIRAFLLMLRVVILLIMTGLFLTYTTTPISLTDGLEQLLSPLAKIKVPVHDFSMMMTIALRFIPTLIEETSKIIDAQKARGADFASGGLIKRVKSIIPIIIPLFVSSFRRANELAGAMECRCYTGGEGRTRMNVLHLGAKDIIFFFVTAAIGAGIILINNYLPAVFTLTI